mgnify:FL=1
MSNTPIIDKVIEELRAEGIEVNISYPHVRKNKKQFQKSNTYILKNEYSTRKLILRIKDMEDNIWII